MKTYDLNEKIIFSDKKPIKKHFLNAKGFHAALICLKSGVEIRPITALGRIGGEWL